MTTKSVQVKIELGHKASLRKKQTTEGFTHDWTVFIRGPEGSNIQHFVEKCVFYLHDSFPKPKRAVKEPPYQISESGYGSFNLPVEIYFKTKEEPRKIRFDYDLFLHLDDAPPVNHVRCEKLTFKNPTEDFRRKLIKAGGVGIPGAGDGPAVTLSTTGSVPQAAQPQLPAESQAFADLFGGGHTDEQTKHGDSSHSKKRKSHSKDKVRDKDRPKSKSTSSGHHQTTPSQPAPKPSSPHGPHSHDKSVKPSSKRSIDEPTVADPAPAKKKKKDKEKDKDRERSRSSSSKPSSSSRDKHESKHKSSKTPSDGVKSATHGEKAPEKERDHSKDKHRHRERSSESSHSQSKSHKKSHKEKHSEKPPTKQEPLKTASPQKEAKSPSKSKSEHSHSGYKRPKSIIPSVEASHSHKLALSDSAGEDTDVDLCEDPSPELTQDVLGSSQSGTKNTALESRSKNFMLSLLEEQSDEDSMDEEVDVEGGASPKVSQLFTPPTLSPPKLSPPKFSPPKLSPPKLVLPKMSPPKVVPPKVSPSRPYRVEPEVPRAPAHDTQLSVNVPAATSNISPPKSDDRHRKHSASPQKVSSDKSYSSHSSQGKRHKSHTSPSLTSAGALPSQSSRSDKDRTLSKSKENSGKRKEIDLKEKESIKHSSPIPVKPKNPEEAEFTSIKEQDHRSLASQKNTVPIKRKEPEVIKEKEPSWGGSPQSTVVAKRRDPEANKERDSSPAVWGASQNTVLAKSNKISRFSMDPPDLLKSTKDSGLFGFQSTQRSMSEREKENQRSQHITNGGPAGSKPVLLDTDVGETQLIPGCAPNGEAFELLLGLQQKLNATKDESVLSEVVHILEDSGEVFSMTDASLDFDLCYVNSDTVHKLKHCLQLV